MVSMPTADRNPELDALRGLVESLDRRVRRLEDSLAEANLTLPPLGEDAPAEPRAPGARGGSALVNTIAFAGRSLLVLGGAFALRALTEGGMISPAIGVGLGLAYAMVWIALSWRAGARGATLSGAFHGFSAVAIAFPLVWEATARFAMLGASASALSLAAVIAAGLAAAWRADVRLTAWAFVLGGIATACALFVATTAAPLFAGLLILVGVGTLALAASRGWTLLRWPAAAAADLTVLFALTLVASPEGPPDRYRDVSAGSVQAVALALALAYLGAFAVETLLARRPATAFTVWQSAAVLVIGFGGAVRLAEPGPVPVAALGALALAISGSGYALAFSFVDRALKVRRNFYYFAWLALACLVVGMDVMMRGPGLTALFCALSVGCAALGARYRRVTLRVHAAVYAAIAAVQSGLLAGALGAFLGGTRGNWDSLGGSAALTAAAAGLSLTILHRNLPPGRVNWFGLLPRFVLAGVLIAGIGGFLVRALAESLLDPDTASHAARLAGIRTAVIAAAAAALTVAGRRQALAELTWFIYPLLLFGAVKLLGEDLRRGDPAMLFVALACFGAALIVAARAGRVRFSVE